MKQSDKPQPPRWQLTFFRWYCHPDYQEDIEGDLLERFERRLNEEGVKKARWEFGKDVIRLFRPGIIRPLSVLYPFNQNSMLKNHFKIGWRNMLKHKGYSLINISGLAVGMAVALLIGMWVHNELSFNRYHDNHDRIAWVMQNQNFGGEIQTWQHQALPLAPELRENYGGHFKHVIMSSFPQRRVLRQDNKSMIKKGIFMEAVAPEMLTLRMLSGTRQGLSEPNTILLPESTARAIFGDQDPLDQMLMLGEQEVKVTGVYENLPDNSSFADVEFIAPWKLHLKKLPDNLGWGASWFQTIVQIADYSEFAQVSEAIKDAKMKRVGGQVALAEPELFLHPMDRMHLYSEFNQGVPTSGRIQYVWLFGTIGVLVLLLACINFTNLSTARSERRAKEIGVRKAVGSRRSQLVGQLFTETLLIVALAFVVSILLVWLVLPAFNEVADKEVRVPYMNPVFWLIGLSFILLTGTLAGSYPALYLSSLKAVQVLKGSSQLGRLGALPRKVLVVSQFVVSVSLIIGTMVVFQQIQFVKDRPIGYNIDRLISVPIRSNEVNQRFSVLRNDLLQTGTVEEVAKIGSPITDVSAVHSGFSWRGKALETQDEFVATSVSYEFGKTVGWEIVNGRDFSRAFATDSMSVIINETAANYMEMENPIGEEIKNANGTYTIVGVVKDMITQSPYSPIKQMIFFLDEVGARGLHIKLQPHTSTPEALASIEAIFKKYDPVNPFEYEFVDEQYAQKFGYEVRVGKLSGFAAILAIMISCLGLFGLASFVAEQRAKEIGIRKVLGASVANLWQLLSIDFLALILIACLVAIPMTYYFALDWLQNYDYRTDLKWWIFAGTTLGALLITLLTVSFQTIRASLANPVETLRQE